MTSETIRTDLSPNTLACETWPYVKPTGFREYDARWLYPEHVNLEGFRCLGAAFATQLRELGQDPPRVVVGHDYRSYSSAVKHALVAGLLSAGAQVHDIGLAVTPLAYFARLHLGVPAVAMVTASHNENGWTGVKFGDRPPVTHGPAEMLRLKEITLSGRYDAGAGRYVRHHDVAEAWMARFAPLLRLSRPLKVVVATGNGTAGAFVPELLRRAGCEVVELDCGLDWTFPRYNPNPEDMAFLRSLQGVVRAHGAAAGLAFDGDGDRLGVVDDQGHEVFADKVGLLVARDLSADHPGARFVVDVKATGLFRDDPVLAAAGASTEYWITGHSYLKRRLHETGGLAGFEKSGHFFFAPPVGEGYDDAALSALLLCRLLDRAGRPLSALLADLPRTYQSPTLSPSCADEIKYDVVARVRETVEGMAARGERLLGQPIADVLTVNGVRVTLADGTWGLVRASSNKPSLVVVVESPVSEALMKAMFGEMDRILRAAGPVGAYDQGL